MVPFPLSTPWFWVAVAFGFGLLSDIVRRCFMLPRRSFKGKHVLITGGSQGIGKALGVRLLARGARVTLLARTESALQAATAELRSQQRTRGDEPKVQYVAASITDSAQLAAKVAEASQTFGPPDVLFACAGKAAPGEFLRTDADEFTRAIELNYVGTVRSIKAVVDGMVQRRDGQIVIVGSAMSVVGFMGYATYAPAKHALRGLADVLRNELTGFNIAVQIAYPPDTETPGFEEENRTKPIETVKMVPIDIFPAEKVAEAMLRGAESGLYHLPSPDLALNLLTSSLSGVTPRAYPFLESILMPIASLIESAVSVYFDIWGRRYALRHARERAGAMG